MSEDALLSCEFDGVVWVRQTAGCVKGGAGVDIDADDGSGDTEGGGDGANSDHGSLPPSSASAPALP